MAVVMIGIDPHKASHTAVAISAAEEPLGELRVRACAAQAERLLAWAAAWPQRTWAVEGAGGLGHLLARQLPGAGERVLDVQPKLGARVRLLTAGDPDKNDPDDARPVAIAALRSAGVREARPGDHAAVLKIWSKRYRDLGRTRTQVACRLHAVLCELIPGGLSKEITAGHAARVLEAITPAGAVEAARCELAAAFAGDLRGIDARIRQARARLATAIQATGTSLTGLFGVGPVIAAAVIGDVRDVSRFPGRDHFAACNGTAPIEVSSGQRKVCRLSRRGNRRLNHAIQPLLDAFFRVPGQPGALRLVGLERQRSRHDSPGRLREGVLRRLPLRTNKINKQHLSNRFSRSLMAGPAPPRPGGSERGEASNARLGHERPRREPGRISSGGSNPGEDGYGHPEA
jgi:transposase